MIATATLPGAIVTEAADTLARATGVAEFLPAVLTATRQLFPAGRVSVDVEQDAEMPDCRWLLVTVETADDNVERLLDAEEAWIQSTGRVCPASLTHHFVLNLLGGR